MFKVMLMAGGTLLLTSCAAQFTREAEAACTAAAGQKDIYDDCVRLEYNRRVARVERIRQGLANMSPPATGGYVQPAQPAQPMRPMRTLRTSYVSGFNRICVYDTIAGQEVVTIQAAQICPIS